MRLFAIADVGEGEAYPDAWVSVGFSKGVDPLPYLALYVPIPVKRLERVFRKASLRLSWSIPWVVMTRYGVARIYTGAQKGYQFLPLNEHVFFVAWHPVKVLAEVTRLEMMNVH